MKADILKNTACFPEVCQRINSVVLLNCVLQHYKHCWYEFIKTVVHRSQSLCQTQTQGSTTYEAAATSTNKNSLIMSQLHRFLLTCSDCLSSTGVRMHHLTASTSQNGSRELVFLTSLCIQCFIASWQQSRVHPEAAGPRAGADSARAGMTD